MTVAVTIDRRWGGFYILGDKTQWPKDTLYSLLEWAASTDQVVHPSLLSIKIKGFINDK
jgi:hypothetical protein